VLLAGAYYERTADRPFAEAIWPNVEAALAWIDRYGDRDGDGFVEYQRRAADGLLHQGWQDSDDAVSHADGTPALGAIALCEVQAYVYAARRAGAVLVAALVMPARAAELKRQAEEIREWFEAGQVWFDRPRLPSVVSELRITNLDVAGATVDLLLVRHGDDISVNVLRRDGDLSVVVAK
jgi:glycogen debranching enzyme